MITERTLKQWRRDALADAISPIQKLSESNGEVTNQTFLINQIQQLSQRILRLTQELLDQHLLRKA